MTKRVNIPLRDAFSFFREAWSPRAAYHLARMRFGAEWVKRFESSIWLAENHIPWSGAAPSMQFRGLPNSGKKSKSETQRRLP